MYDEKLEQLIDAALADGVLTEKENFLRLSYLIASKKQIDSQNYCF